MATVAVLSFTALSPVLAAEKESSNTGTETGMAAMLQ
jgi:hypothetical protein